jgi:hypothetical protein
MKRLIVAALFTSAAWAQAQTAATPATPASPAKKELVQKFLTQQQPGIESVARGLVERPVAQMAQEVRGALQQMPADKREAAVKEIDADIKKYIDEAVPIVRDRAVKLAPSTIGTMMEEKFTEDELKQLIAWFDSPVNKKYGQISAEMQGNFTQKLVTEMAPTIDPKMQALVAKVRASLGVPPAAKAGSAPAKAAAPAKKASGK